MIQFLDAAFEQAFRKRIDKDVLGIVGVDLVCQYIFLGTKHKWQFAGSTPTALVDVPPGLYARVVLEFGQLGDALIAPHCYNSPSLVAHRIEHILRYAAHEIVQLFACSHQTTVGCFVRRKDMDSAGVCLLLIVISCSFIDARAIPLSHGSNEYTQEDW